MARPGNLGGFQPGAPTDVDRLNKDPRGSVGALHRFESAGFADHAERAACCR
jgi:hypothetical protein